MKVTTHTPDLLIIDDRPLFIAIALILFTLAFVGAGLLMVADGVWAGLIFAFIGGGMGIGFFALFVRRLQLILNRPENYIEWRRKNMFRQSAVRYPLADVSHADLEVSRSSDGPSTYRVTIVIPEGENVGHHPVTLAYSNGSGHRKAKDAINLWLSGQTA